MTIETVRRTTVGEVLAEDLRIPPYQRPYRWEPTMAMQLLDDIRLAEEENNQKCEVPYVLGAVIIHNEKKVLNVVDGQQRLLTLHMILTLLEATSDHNSSITFNDNSIGRVWSSLSRIIKGMNEDFDNQYKQKLAKFIREYCELIRIETDDIDEAFRVFDSQNYRGRPLAPHDLLKAYHLREMSEETPAIKAAAVEAWESVGDDDLDRLFSIYLYRIARWSRGESAPGFTIHDIGMFKGISPKKSRSPNAYYHTAAQAAITFQNMWKTSFSEEKERDDMLRMRFQLDAPLLAGRPFFEMVAFMLTELKKLALKAFPDDRQKFGLYKVQKNNEHTEECEQLKEQPYQSRYRYVTELYLAVLLYYTNKFGYKDFKEVSDQLFAWAYSLRIERLRVQFQSIDNLARGAHEKFSAFTFIRNTYSVANLNPQSIPVNLEQNNKDHEEKLVNHLKNRGFNVK